MSKRHQYSGCDIKVGEWGTTVHGRDLRHAISKLDEHVQEKYKLSLPEYLGQNGTGKRVHRASRPFLPIRRNDAVDVVVLKMARRRWR